MKKLVLLLVALVLLGVLVIVYLPITPNEPAPQVGADKDAHGCIASAGYTYSVVRNDCIRLWEEGTALSPVGAEVDGPTLVAYVVRSANWQQAEVFLPGQATSLVLTLQKTSGITTWVGPQGNWVLTYDKEQGWQLSADGQLLYTAPAEEK